MRLTSPITITISACGSVDTLLRGGFDSSDFEDDFLACTGSGDCESACQAVIDNYEIEYRIVKLIDGKWRNVIASDVDKRDCCEAIYFDSDSDFNDTDLAELYIVWEAAHQFANELPENR